MLLRRDVFDQVVVNPDLNAGSSERIELKEDVNCYQTQST